MFAFLLTASGSDLACWMNSSSMIQSTLDALFWSKHNVGFKKAAVKTLCTYLNFLIFWFNFSTTLRNVEGHESELKNLHD